MKPLKEISNADFFVLRRAWEKEAKDKGLLFTMVPKSKPTLDKITEAVVSPRIEQWIKRVLYPW